MLSLFLFLIKITSFLKMSSTSCKAKAELYFANKKQNSLSVLKIQQILFTNIKQIPVEFAQYLLIVAFIQSAFLLLVTLTFTFLNFQLLVASKDWCFMRWFSTVHGL